MPFCLSRSNYKVLTDIEETLKICILKQITKSARFLVIADFIRESLKMWVKVGVTV